MTTSQTSPTFRAIIPFSGGIDSTAALYKTLTQYPQDHFLVVHINLLSGNSGNRAIKENQAVNAILEWLRDHDVHNFSFRTLTIDYSNLGAPPPIWDSEAVNYGMALAIKAYPETWEFVEGAIKNDYEDPGFHARLERIAKILYFMTERTPADLQIVFPLKDLNKAEVMASLPPDLLPLTWSCRYPTQGQQPWTMERCHKCPPCLAIDEALASTSNTLPPI